MKTYALAATAACALATVPAHAGTLIGATVNISPVFGGAIQPFATGEDRIVDASVEYPFGSFPTYDSRFSLDVEDDRLVIRTNSVAGFTPVTYNGFLLRVVSGPALTGFSVDPTSNFVPVGTSLANGTLFLNYSGAAVPAQGLSIVRLDTSAVPEPATWAMLLLGFGLVGASMRYRTRTARVRIA